MTLPPSPRARSSFREYPKAVQPSGGGPDVVVWDEIEEEEVRTGRKRPPPPTFKVEF